MDHGTLRRKNSWPFYLIASLFLLALLSSFNFLLQTRNESSYVLQEKIISLERKIAELERAADCKDTNAIKKNHNIKPGRDLLKDWTRYNESRPRNVNEPEKFRNYRGVEVVTFAGGLISQDKNPQYLGHPLPNYDCGVPCTFTHDRSRLPFADGVTFEVQALAGYGNDFVAKPPQFPHRMPNQFFVNSGYEQPHYFHLYAHPGYLIHHDIQATYEQKGQVPITFFCNWGGWGGSLEELLNPPPPKTKLIAWFGTNCAGIGGHTHRTEWVGEFMKHIHLDSYGLCHHNIDLPKEMQFPIYNNHGQSMKNKALIFRDYKFGMALENNNITDYVTEKILNVMQGGAIPVYMGAPNVDEWLPDPHSAIKVADFESPKALADYIKKVAEDEELYQSYFAWKKKGFSKQFLERYNNCVYYGAACRLCQKIAEMRDVLEREDKIFEQKPNPEVSTFVTPHALKLNGNAHVEIPPHPDLDLEDDYTIAGWIHPTKVDYMRIVDKGTAGVIDGYSLDLVKSQSGADTMNLRLCAAGSCFLSKKIVKVNDWTFAAVVVSVEEVRFYFHSMLDSVHAYTELTKTNSFPLCFGKIANGVGSHFEGILDDISIWKRPLSLKEIRKLSFQILNGNEKGLVGFWSFNEGVGDVVHDHTAKAHNGKVYGDYERLESSTKPLILPNVKKNWQNTKEPFLNL